MTLASIVLLLTGCGEAPPRPQAKESVRQIRVDSYATRQDTQAVCEVVGQLTNIGPERLQRLILIAHFYQGERHKGVAQLPVTTSPIAPGQSVEFSVPYACEKAGDRLSFEGEDGGEEIRVVRARN